MRRLAKSEEGRACFVALDAVRELKLVSSKHHMPNWKGIIISALDVFECSCTNKHVLRKSDVGGNSVRICTTARVPFGTAHSHSCTHSEQEVYSDRVRQSGCFMFFVVKLHNAVNGDFGPPLPGCSIITNKLRWLVYRVTPFTVQNLNHYQAWASS